MGQGVLMQKELDLYNERGSPLNKPHYFEIDVNDPEQLRQVAADMAARKGGVKRDNSVEKLAA